MNTNELEPGAGQPEPGPGPTGPGATTAPGTTATASTEETASGHDGPRVTRDEMRDVRRLRRPRERTVAGVCAGLARHFDVDPVLLRIAFVVLAFFGGAGLLLYGALWLLLPEDGAARAPLHLDEHSRGVAVAGVAVLAALLVVGDSWGGFHFPWPLALLALAVWFLFFRERGSAGGGSSTGGGYPAAPPAPGQPYAAPAMPPPGTPYGGAPAAPVPPQDAAASAYAWTPPPPRPRDPRRRGPLLFGFTVALILFALGCLGLADVAGADVLGSAYPALALGVVAAMLVLGAFWGRAGGLIALGLVIALVTAGATASERSTDEVVTERPLSASTLEQDYWLSAGELVLDLTEVDDLEALDGRQVDLAMAAGSLQVIVPDDLDVDVTARVSGPGSVRLFEVERGGIDVESSTSRDAGPGDDPRIELDIEIAVGEIIVRSES